MIFTTILHKIFGLLKFFKSLNHFSKKLNYSLTPDKNFDFGLGFGAEYNLDSGLFFDATFNLGLTELSTKDYSKDGKNWVPMKFKNRVIQIGVGYKF